MRPTAMALHMASLLLMALLAHTVYAQPPSQSLDAQSLDAPLEEMREFLNAWVFANNEEEAKSYFSVSEQARMLAPDGEFFSSSGFASSNILQAVASQVTEEQQGEALRTGYLGLMNHVWRPETADDLAFERASVRENVLIDRENRVAIELIDRELIVALEERLGVRVLSNEGEPFIVFVADNELSITTFDYTNGEAAEILRPAERTTLGMMVGIVAGGEERPNPGPFVSFWQQEGDEWRIQMVGAIQP